MSEFDVAVGLDQPTMNAAAAVVYQKLYPNIFTGSQQVEQSGIQLQVGWDVKAPPTFNLAPPQDGQAILEAHLADWAEATSDMRSRATEALSAAFSTSTFEMLFSNVALSVSGGGTSGTDQVSLTVYVQANSADGKMSLIPLKAVGTTQNPADQWVLNNVILPQAMKMAGTLLSGVTLPPLQFSGISLTAPTMAVQQNHVVALANLAGSSAPTPPSDVTWPQSSFFGLLSDNARYQVAVANTKNFSQHFNQSGEVGSSIGGAGYSADLYMYNLSIGMIPGNPTAYTFSVKASGNVQAHIKVACTKIGINYNLSTNTDPSGTIQLSIQNGNVVGATVTGLGNFVFILEPSGNPLEWILSAITDPIMQAVVAAFSPLITNAMKGISFQAWTIPSIPINIGNFNFTVTPQNLSLGNYQSLMAITGSAAIS